MSRLGWSDGFRAAAAPGEMWPIWLRPLSVAVPWATVGLLFAMIVMIGGVLTSAEGVLFDLPEKGVGDVAETSAAALVLPTAQGTVVFFDDTRYVLGDEGQMAKFGIQLKDRVSLSDAPTLLVLADRRVKTGELMKVAAVARQSQVRRILFAEKRGEGVGE